MKPTSPVEDANIPLDDPSDEMMDGPQGGPMPGAEGEEQEPPPMDAPIDDQPLGPQPQGAEGAQGPDDSALGDSPGAASGGTGAITGKYNSSPVGDIKMSKSKGTYNTYKLEMSMGQLEVVLSALEKNHADPVSDELLATIRYYIDKLPGPGEEEEEAEARNNPGKAGAAGLGGDEDEPLPMPPGQGGAGGAKPDLANMPEPSAPGGAAMPPGKARMLGKSPKGKPGLPGPDTDQGAGAGGASLPPAPQE
jgi:hypothetical protein